MRRGESQRGEGRLGTLFALTLIAVMIYLGVKVVPVMISAYSLRDFMEEEARFASVRKDDNLIKKRVLEKAQELDLPVNMKQIRTRRTSAKFDILVRYSIPIETPVYTYVWQLDERVSSPLF